MMFCGVGKPSFCPVDGSELPEQSIKEELSQGQLVTAFAASPIIFLARMKTAKTES